MSHAVCVDASIFIKWLVFESDSERALSLRDYWRDEGIELVAPAFFIVETISSLRQKVLRRELSPALGAEGVRLATRFPIRLVTGRLLLRRAWELAAHFDLPTCYDTCYLAVAEHERCEFWTADSQLVRCVQHELDWVRHLSDWGGEQ